MTEYQQPIKELSSAYLEILTNTDITVIYRDTGLSGIFLASPDPSYFESQYKVMVIGQEPKQWRSQCPMKTGSTPSDEIIQASMHDAWDQSTKPGKHRLLHYYRRCSREMTHSHTKQNNAAVWANQLCMSKHKKAPLKSTSIKPIAELSARLLRVQFDILKPDYAVFTTGNGRDRFINSVFDCAPTGQNSIEPTDLLWHFKVGDTVCFRINHPAARGVRAPLYKKYRDTVFARVRELQNA